MRLILLAATIFFAFDAYARATAILAVWFPTFVIIAADSREVMKSGPPPEACKISVVGDVAVAEAGVLEFGSKDNPTKVDTLIRIELRKDEPIAIRLKSIESGTLWVINNIYDTRRSRGEDVTRLGTELFLTYNEGGSMVADYYAARYENSTNKIVEPKRHCPSPECTPGMVFPMGHTPEILQIAKSYSTIPAQSEIPDRFREIIQRVAEQLPNAVGGPISILKITPDGRHEWIASGKCSDSN
jgi:hypothetical protein